MRTVVSGPTRLAALAGCLFIAIASPPLSAGQARSGAEVPSGVAFLGVELAERADEPGGGARVAAVVDGSPAARAGLLRDDVIVAIDDGTPTGGPIGGPMELTERIHASRPGERRTLAVLRDGARLSLVVELGARSGPWGLLAPPDAPAPPGKANVLPDGTWAVRQRDYVDRLRDLHDRMAEVAPAPESGPAPRAYFLPLRGFTGRPRLGVELVRTTPELRRHLGGDAERGVLVSRVLTGTPAERADLRVGDLILSVDGDPVASPEQLIDALRRRDGAVFPLDIVREGEQVRLSVSLPETSDPEPAAGPHARLVPGSISAAPRAPRAPRPAARVPAPPAGPAAASPLQPVPAPPAPAAASPPQRTFGV